MMKTKLFVFFFLIISSFTQAQNEHWWWYEIHQHDGVTPWQRYLVMSPAFFGPNAFPIPEIQNGKLSEQLTFETALELHLNAHEQTDNIYTKLSIPLIRNKVALFFNLVPMEHYSYDTLIRDQRFSRNYEGKGFASGDLYIGTQIQLIENHAKWPDLLLGINLRTASGNDFESARFADSPGYFFDLSAGKSILFNEEGFIKSIRWYAVLGFYVWQTNFSDHMQDDALLYGAGLQFNTKHSSWSNELGGFYGYLGNGDRPTVFRSKFKTRLTEKLQISSQFENGLVDYNFRSFRISLIYIFKS